MDNIRFLSLMDIVALHKAAMQLSDQLPTDLVREDALESATHQAKNAVWYMGATPPEVAVHLATHIAMAHPWVDGNKRTAVMTGIQFALVNGARDPSREQMLKFGDLLLKYIETSHEGRVTVFAEFVEFVEGWFVD